MISFIRIERFTRLMAARVNWLAAAAVSFIMFLTTADVILRFFRHPIPGTYEIVAFTGALVIAFAIPYTTVEKGHIAVEVLVQRLPWLARVIINVINDALALILFALITWQSLEYARDLKLSGEVSATLQMPTYPFVYGVALGCGLLCWVLLVELVRELRGAEVG